MIPFESFYLISPIKPGPALKEVAERIEPEKFGLLAGAPVTPFVGRVIRYEDRFEIRRVIHYRNGFLPLVLGRVQRYGEGSRIQIRMRPPTFALVCFCIMLVGGSVGLFMELASWWESGQFQPGCLFVLFWLALVYALPTASFKFESAKAKSWLREIFQAELEGGA